MRPPGTIKRVAYTPTRAEAETSVRQVRRAWENETLRRVTGLLTALPIPGLAYALSGANVAAVPAAGLRAVAAWPRFAKALIALSLIGAIVTAVSALAQRVDIANLTVISTLSLTLLVAGFVKLTGGVRDAVHLLAWLSVGMIGFFVIVGADNTRDTFEHLWKYGVAVPLALLLVSLISTASVRRLWPVLALLAIGASSVALGFRSHGLICVAVVLILFAKGSSKSRHGRVFKVALAALLFYALSVAAPLAIDSGLFGEGVRARTEEQLTSGASPLLSGRVEPPLSIAAISARFWFGWGHLNAIDYTTIAHGQQIAAQLGLTNPGAYMNLWVRRDGRVSVHSVLFEAWAQGGVIAALGPLVMIAIFVLAIARTTGKWAPIVLLVSVQGIWDVLFSTWGAQRPQLLAVSIVIAMWAITATRPRAHDLDLTEVDRASAQSNQGTRFATR